MAQNIMSDADIVALYFERDERAIRETSLKYGRYCLGVALQILQNMQDAEECVNDTYLKAWDAIPPQRPSKLGAFLSKITRHLALDKYKAYTAAKRGGTDFILSIEELGECIPDPASDFDALRDTAHIGHAINTFLKSEGALARKIFVCRYFYGDSVSQIASRFACSESTVKSSLYRTRNRLKSYLKKEGIHL